MAKFQSYKAVYFHAFTERNIEMEERNGNIASFNSINSIDVRYRNRR